MSSSRNSCDLDLPLTPRDVAVTVPIVDPRRHDHAVDSRAEERQRRTDLPRLMTRSAGQRQKRPYARQLLRPATASLKAVRPSPSPYHRWHT